MVHAAVGKILGAYEAEQISVARYHEKVALVLVVVPSRSNVDQYKQLKEEVYQLSLPQKPSAAVEVLEFNPADSVVSRQLSSANWVEVLRYLSSGSRFAQVRLGF